MCSSLVSNPDLPGSLNGTSMYVKDAPSFSRLVRTKSIETLLTSSISSILKDLKEMLYVTIVTILPLVQITRFCEVERTLRKE